VDGSFPPVDTFDALDIEKLSDLLVVLKEAEVPYFRFGDLEIGMNPSEPEKPVGFVPRDQQAITQAEKAAAPNRA